MYPNFVLEHQENAICDCLGMNVTVSLASQVMCLATVLASKRSDISRPYSALVLLSPTLAANEIPFELSIMTAPIKYPFQNLRNYIHQRRVYSDAADPQEYDIISEATKDMLARYAKGLDKEVTECYLFRLLELEGMRSELRQISSITGQVKALCLEKNYELVKVDSEVKEGAKVVLNELSKEITDIRRNTDF